MAKRVRATPEQIAALEQFLTAQQRCQEAQSAFHAASSTPKKAYMAALRKLRQARRDLEKARGTFDFHPSLTAMPVLAKDNPSEVIAECIADAGYGTSYYDEETSECTHESYASVTEVISNPEYWKQYEEMLSAPLNHDFNLGFNFDRFRLRVYRDGRREAEQIPSDQRK